jgi:hypothetical protein
MTKMIAPSIVLIVIVALGGVARAQAGAGSAAAGAAPVSPAASDPAVPGSPPPPAPPPASPASGSGDARKACTDAMNADPQFAASIIKIADEAAAAERDRNPLEAHKAANHHIQKNERHVIYAYAAMWIIAAGFVIFLWRRQQALKLEISNLRRDLEASAEPDPKART